MTFDEKTQLLCGTHITDAIAGQLLQHVIHCNWRALRARRRGGAYVNILTRLSKLGGTCIHRHYDSIWEIDFYDYEVILSPQNRIAIDLYMSPVDCKPATCKRSDRIRIYITEKYHDTIDILIPSDDGKYWKHVCAEGSECRTKKHPLSQHAHPLLQQAHPLQKLRMILQNYNSD